MPRLTTFRGHKQTGNVALIGVQGDDRAPVDSYKLSNAKMAKRLWQIAVEHHAFFR